MKLKIYRPQSFFSLLITGFVFVSMPLLTALYSSVHILDTIVRQSSMAVYRSVDRATDSRNLVDLIHDQERKARLFNVLGDPQHLREVREVHQSIEHLLHRLEDLDFDRRIQYTLERVRALENHIVAVLLSGHGDPLQRKKEQARVLERYSELNALAYDIEESSANLMLQEVQRLKDDVARGKQNLAWQTTGLIVFSVLLIIVFVFLIAKPISQIDRAIERLGSGDFKTPISVAGPRDLELVGRKLDWLRKRLA